MSMSNCLRFAEERAYNKEFERKSRHKRNQDINIPLQRLPAPARLRHGREHLQLSQRRACYDRNASICYMPISQLALRDL